jgi:hypothetical protein
MAADRKSNTSPRINTDGTDGRRLPKIDEIEKSKTLRGRSRQIVADRRRSGKSKADIAGIEGQNLRTIWQSPSLETVLRGVGKLRKAKIPTGLKPPIGISGFAQD